MDKKIRIMSPAVVEALVDEKETYFIARVLLVLGQ
jgi:pheromone shutdown protein TraB